MTYERNYGKNNYSTYIGHPSPVPQENKVNIDIGTLSKLKG